MTGAVGSSSRWTDALRQRGSIRFHSGADSDSGEGEALMNRNLGVTIGRLEFLTCFSHVRDSVGMQNSAVLRPH